jgi:NADPH:quinone reductase-like Zn-dependent oxidoreductase
VREAEDPLGGPEDIVVDVKTSALNRADLSQVQGNYPAPPGLVQDIPGLEMAGVVAEVGSKVFDHRVGDRVFGLLAGGDYTSKVSTHQGLALPIPPNLDFLQAVAVPEVFLTA